MSNEPLFDKIKMGLDNYQASYNPSDWEQMEQMLDQHKRIVPTWVWSAAAGVAILLAATFGYMYFNQQEAPMVMAQMSETPIQQPTLADITTTDADQTTGATTAEKSRANTSKTSAQNNSQWTVHTKNTGQVPPAKQDHQSMGAAKADKNTAALDRDQNKQAPNAGLLTKMSKEEMAFIDIEGRQLPDHTINTSGSDSKRSSARFWIGPSVKPSLQFVSNLEGTFGKGVLAGVDFNEKIGIEGGIFYQEMKYDEKPTSRFSINEAHVGSQGNITGLSIPVKATYRFNEGNLLQPMIHAGVTAFIPLKERYIFEYTTDPSVTNNQGFQQNTGMDNLGTTTRDTITITTSNQEFGYSKNSVTNNAPERYASSPTNVSKLYLMASAGAGLRLYFNPRLSMQLSANYVQPLSGIGIEERSLRQVDFGLAMQYYIN